MRDGDHGGVEVAGYSLSRLTARAGQTSFFVYDRDLVSRTVQRLRTSMPANLRLHYSIKANPMPGLVHHVASLVDGLDVASAGELTLALETTKDADEILFAGPGKTDASIRQAVAAGVVITIESFQEVRRVAHAAHGLGCGAQVMIRMAPEFSLRNAGMKMSGNPTQFGVEPSQIAAVFAEVREHDLDFVGFHVFAGSQCLDATALADTLGASLDLSVRMAQELGVRPRLVNIGGGFGVPYHDGQPALDASAVLAALAP